MVSDAACPRSMVECDDNATDTQKGGAKKEATRCFYRHHIGYFFISLTCELRSRDTRTPMALRWLYEN